MNGPCRLYTILRLTSEAVLPIAPSLGTVTQRPVRLKQARRASPFCAAAAGISGDQIMQMLFEFDQKPSSHPPYAVRGWGIAVNGQELKHNVGTTSPC